MGNRITGSADRSRDSLVVGYVWAPWLENCFMFLGLTFHATCNWCLHFLSNQRVGMPRLLTVGNRLGFAIFPRIYFSFMSACNVASLSWCRGSNTEMDHTQISGPKSNGFWKKGASQGRGRPRASLACGTCRLRKVKVP